MKTHYGGELQIGDLIAIADGNIISLGWYCGRGRGETVQYYSIFSACSIMTEYRLWEKGIEPENAYRWGAARREEFETVGLHIKMVKKCYINSVTPWRIIKITNPEDSITGEKQIEAYLETKEFLNKVNFPAK
jgi:hypothetical protein